MWHKQLWLLAIALAITGCVADTPAPVIDKSRQSEYAYVENEAVCKAQTSDEFCHVVERGDTLYSISRRYGLKVVEIASRNAIKSPYIIRPNDLLVVRQGEETVRSTTANPTQRVEERSREIVAEPTLKPEIEKPISETSPSQPPAETIVTPPARSESTPSDSVAVQPVRPPLKMTLRTTRTKSGWQWPVPYEPLATREKKGLEYLLADETKIVAAIGGKVIYAGAGLNKYRHLIIVDSATSHLVAYEFNTAHDIKEGQSISSGDTITRIMPRNVDESIETARYQQFRFEIWANGKPLNPDTVIGVAATN